MDNFKERLKLIKEIEKETNSNLINLVYNTSNTRFRTQLASDVLSCINMLIRSIPGDKKKEKISLMLHSSGGFLDVITSVVYIIRKKFKQFDVIIPEVAHSAATILSFGADNILMSNYSSLSPFDPQLSLKTQSGTIRTGAEDIKGYYSLMNELFKEDSARVQAFTILANRFPPELLGNLERVQKQVKIVAFNLLNYLNFSKTKIEAILKNFQEEFFSHQYRIHFDEAKGIGLNVKLMNENIESLCLNLLSFYKESWGGEGDLEIEIPDDQSFSELTINRSYLESQFSSFSFKTKYRIFKDKKVEVEESGWLENEYFKSKKGGKNEN